LYVTKRGRDQAVKGQLKVDLLALDRPKQHFR